jgi:hypothetical protein
MDGSYLTRIKKTDEPTRIVTPLGRNYLYPEGVSQYDAQIGIQSRLGVPCYSVPAGIDQIDTYTGLRPGRLDHLLNAFSERFGVRSVSALRRYSVTHMMIKDPYFPDEVEVAQAASAGGARVLDNREWRFMGWRVPHRPWAFFAGSAVVVHGERDALGSLLISMERGDPTVVLEKATLPKDLSPGKILSFQRENGFLRIEALAGGDGVLVVNDSWWPGWRAFVDGREVPVWRADYLVRAVPWPPGRHILEMRYEPEEVRTGLLLSGVGIIVLLGIIIMKWRNSNGRKSCL